MLHARLCKISDCSDVLIACLGYSGEACAVRNNGRYCACSVDMGIAYEGGEMRGMRHSKQSWLHMRGGGGSRGGQRTRVLRFAAMNPRRRKKYRSIGRWLATLWAGRLL